MICKIIIIIIIIRICCLVVVVANLVWYWWIIIVKWWWWWWKQVHHGLFFLRILSMQKSMKNEKFSLVVLWLCYSHQNSHAKCHPKNFWKKNFNQNEKTIFFDVFNGWWSSFKCWQPRKKKLCKLWWWQQPVNIPK